MADMIKKLMMTSALAGAVFLVACSEGERQDAQNEAEDAVEDASDAMSDAADDAGEALDDAGEAMEEAADDMADTVEDGMDEAAEMTDDAMDALTGYSVVMSVNQLSVTENKDDETGETTGYTLSVSGMTSTGGWTEPTLDPKGVENAGVMVYDFLAIEPEEVTIQVETPIALEYTIDVPPAEITAVRVLAETNQREAALPGRRVDDLMREGEELMNDAGEAIQDAVDSAGEAIDDAMDGAEEAAEETTDGGQPQP